MKGFISIWFMLFSISAWTDSYYCAGESVSFTTNDIHGKISKKVSNTFDLNYFFTHQNGAWQLIAQGSNKTLSKHCSFENGIHTCQHITDRGSFELFKNGLFIIVAYQMEGTEKDSEKLSTILITGRCS